MSQTNEIEGFREYLAANPVTEPMEPDDLAAVAQAHGFPGITGELLEAQARDLITYPNPIAAMFRFLFANPEFDEQSAEWSWDEMASRLQTFGFHQVTGELLSATCYRRGDELTDEDLELVGGGFTPATCTPTNCSPGNVPILPTPRPTPRPGYQPNGQRMW